MKTAQAPSTAAKTPSAAPGAAAGRAVGGASPLQGMTYAAGKAATAPGGPGIPGDPRTAPYAAGKAMVSPEAVAPAETVPEAGPGTEGEEQARQAAAAASYSKLLGAALGPKLYDLVGRELSAEKLMGLANQGLAGVLDAVVGKIAPVDGNQAMDTAEEADAVKQFAGALGDWTKGAAAEWLAGPDGAALATKISQFAQGNPELVVGAALMAALGAVAANVALPKLQQSAQVAEGVTVSGAVDLGRIRQIALQAVELGVQYKKGEVEAGLTWSMTKGDAGGPAAQTLAAKIGNATSSVNGDLTVQGDNVVIKTAAQHQGNGYQVSGGVQHSRGGGSDPATLANATVSIGGQDKNVTANATYDASAGELTIGADALRDFGNGVKAQAGMTSKQGAGSSDTSATGKLSYEKDGSTASLGVAHNLTSGDTSVDIAGKRQLSNGSIGGSVAMDAQGGVSAGLQGEAELTSGLKVKLDAMLAADGTARASVGAEQQIGDFLAQGSADVNLTTGQLEKLALHLGYQDPEKLRSVLVDYKRTYDGDLPLEQFDVQLSAQIDKLTLRATDSTVLRDGKMASNVAHLEAGLQLNDNVTAIAGIRHGMEGEPGLGGLSDRNRGTWLEAGVQVKGVPLVLGVRPEDGAVSVGVTIPF